ncbi:acyltransferase family protein [Spirosoma linguale]
MDILQPQRQYYIDWIRVIAFMILILFHCSMPFVQFGWEVKNAEHSIFLDRLIIWLHQWRLPLLFFIAGVGVSFSLRKRSVLSFMGERVIRLFIPLLFSMFFVIPIQVYVERLQKKEINESYWSFYPSVWDLVPYPEGTLTWSHLWFVVYLFVFTILLVPIFALFKIKALQRWKQRLDPVFAHPIANLSLALPFILHYFAFYIRWPIQGSLLDDWFLFNSSITFYFLGYFLADLSSFWNTCETYRNYFLAVAVLCVIILFWKYYWTVALPTQQNDALYLYGFFDGLHIWAIILTVIGFARRYLNFSNPALAYLTTAVYPFYILHQTIIVASGYYVVQWSSPIWVKLLVLIIICFILLFGLYHFLIRPFVFTRILYGLKPKRIRLPKSEFFRDQASVVSTL